LLFSFTIKSHILSISFSEKFSPILLVFTILANSEDSFAIEIIGFPADIRLKVFEGILKSPASDSKVTTPILTLAKT
jgi:hypothetical protein